MIGEDRRAMLALTKSRSARFGGRVIHIVRSWLYVVKEARRIILHDCDD